MMKTLEDWQKANQKTLDATVRSFGEVNKGLQSLASEMTGYTKKSFEDGTAVFEQLIGTRSLEQMFEIQSDYVRKSYDDAVQQASKLSAICADMSKDAYKPIEKAIAKTGKQ